VQSVTNRTKGVVSYLVLAFGMAWLAWGVPIRMRLSLHSPLFQLALLPGAFAPAVSAAIVRRFVTREGFADAGLRLHLDKWRYYLVAWLLPVPVTAAIVAMAFALGISKPDFSLMRFSNWLTGATGISSMPSYVWAVIPFQLSVNALLATPVLWGEEFGWRGYLQVRLLAERPLLAAVTTGLIWGLWHFPLNVRGYNYPDHPMVGLMIFPVGTVLLSIIFGWLRLRTGSVWAASLAHSATNAIGASLTMLLFQGGPNWLFVSYLGLLGWLPLGILCVWIVFTGRLNSSIRDTHSCPVS